MTMTSSLSSSLSSLSATMKKQQQQQQQKKKKNLAFPSIKDTNRYHRRRGGEISVAACATQPRGRGEEAGAEKREINTNNKNNLNNKEYSFNASRRSNKLNQSSKLTSRGKSVIMHSGGGGFSLSKLTSVLKKKTQSDFDRVISGTSKTREKLSYMDEILGLWRLEDLDDTLDDLEETLLSVDFGPKTAGKVLDTIRELVEDGKIKTGEDCKRALKETIVNILVNDGGDPTKMNVSDDEKIPTCVLIIGVNGGGKTTTIGKLSNWYKNAGAKVMMVPGDTFRAAAAEQLQTWADRTGAIMSKSPPNTKPGAVSYKAVDEAIAMGDIDVILADTSGRLHTNLDLMDELVGVKSSIKKREPSMPHEVLLVLDGTTGLNMLNQAREFGQQLGVTGIILTKLDGTARGGAVISVVDEMKIPVKFVGVGETMEDLQVFEPLSFVDALFPEEEAGDA
jgi:fused signal recognition particle receptor